MKGAHRDLKTLSRGGVSDGLSSNIANTPENSGADDLGLHRMKRHTSLVPFPRVQHYPTQRMYTMKLDWKQQSEKMGKPISIYLSSNCLPIHRERGRAAKIWRMHTTFPGGVSLNTPPNLVGVKNPSIPFD